MTAHRRAARRFRGWDLEQVDYTRPSSSSARAAPTSATCASSPSRTRRPTGATSAPTATASGPRSTRSRSSRDLVAFRERAATGRHLRGGYAHACSESAAATVGLRPRACTPTTGCRSGRPSSQSCGFDPVLSPADRQADPRGGRRRSPSPSPASRSAWRTATCRAARRGRGPRLRAQPGQRRDRVHPSTTRTPARGARRCPSSSGTRPALEAHRGQVPRPARALPRRARGPAARPARG